MYDTGIDFSARYADFNFTSLESLDHVRRYVKNLTELSGRYDREVRLMTIVLVVCRETEEAAWAAYREIERNADLEGGEHFARVHGAPVDKKIGRASCRERVCPNGEVSVGAVTSK